MIHQFLWIEKVLLKLNVIPHPIVDALSHVVAGRALQVSVKTGIADVLGERPQSAMTIARQTGISEGGALVILDCLDALDYVQKEAEGYRLTRRGKKFLSKDSRTSFREVLLFSDYLFNRLTDLEALVKSDEPHHTHYESFTPEFWNIFTHAMAEFARTNAAEIARLAPLPTQAKKLLDLGGSHGLYSIELCKRSGSLVAEIMDFAPVERFARLMIEQHKMSDRIRFRTGDFMTDKLGRNYDVILAFNILHGLSNEANQRLAVKVKAALNAGGIYLILDQIKGVEGRSHLSRLITSSIGLSFFQQFGRCSYAFDEIRDWLLGAGFRRCELRKIRTPGFALVIGEK